MVNDDQIWFSHYFFTSIVWICLHMQKYTVQRRQYKVIILFNQPNGGVNGYSTLLS